MYYSSVSLEINRWGYAHLPGIVLYYARELELDMEDIGLITTMFYAMENSKPLFESGVRAGQVLNYCPMYSSNKLSRRLTRLFKLGCIEMSDENSKNFSDKIIYLEPMMDKLQELILRDHPKISSSVHADDKNEENIEIKLKEYNNKIKEMEEELEKEKNKNAIDEYYQSSGASFKKLADFISKKTGNLMSVKMARELNKWLNEMVLTPEFLLCMLELCFERSINNPSDITEIARDLEEYSISSVEGLELYFKNHVDLEKNKLIHIKQFDPNIMEFGKFTGIDMNAEARKKVYNKWRYDWRFSHQMIMKAGELMCQRTKNGGLEYIDSVLHNWMTKEIRAVNEAEKEIASFKSKNKKEKTNPVAPKKNPVKANKQEYDIYVPPEVIEELKSKV